MKFAGIGVKELSLLEILYLIRPKSVVQILECVFTEMN